jgi:hypothetical protein
MLIPIEQVYDRGPGRWCLLDEEIRHGRPHLQRVEDQEGGRN